MSRPTHSGHGHNRCELNNGLGQGMKLVYLIGLVLACVGLLANARSIGYRRTRYGGPGTCFAGSGGSVRWLCDSMRPVHGADPRRGLAVPRVEFGARCDGPFGPMAELKARCVELFRRCAELGSRNFELLAWDAALRAPYFESSSPHAGLGARHDQPFARVSSAKPGVSSRLLGVRGSEPGFPGSMH